MTWGTPALVHQMAFETGNKYLEIWSWSESGGAGTGGDVVTNHIKVDFCVATGASVSTKCVESATEGTVTITHTNGNDATGLLLAIVHD